MKGWREGWRARGGATVNRVPYSRQKSPVVALSRTETTVAAPSSQPGALRSGS